MHWGLPPFGSVWWGPTPPLFWTPYLVSGWTPFLDPFSGPPFLVAASRARARARAPACARARPRARPRARGQQCSGTYTLSVNQPYIALIGAYIGLIPLHWGLPPFGSVWWGPTPPLFWTPYLVSGWTPFLDPFSGPPFLVAASRARARARAPACARARPRARPRARGQQCSGTYTLSVNQPYIALLGAYIGLIPLHWGLPQFGVVWWCLKRG